MESAAAKKCGGGDNPPAADAAVESALHIANRASQWSPVTPVLPPSAAWHIYGPLRLGWSVEGGGGRVSSFSEQEGHQEKLDRSGSIPPSLSLLPSVKLDRSGCVGPCGSVKLDCRGAGGLPAPKNLTGVAGGWAGLAGREARSVPTGKSGVGLFSFGSLRRQEGTPEWWKWMKPTDSGVGGAVSKRSALSG